MGTWVLSTVLCGASSGKKATDILKSELREFVVKAELKRDCSRIEKFTKKFLLPEGSTNVQVSMEDLVPPDLPF